MKKRVLIGVLGLILLISLFGFIGFASAFSGTGTGTLADPYVILNCTQLQEMNLSMAANYSLGGNIDCSDTANWNVGEGFYPIALGTSGFRGNFEGNRYNITGLYINRPSSSSTGLFATLLCANVTNVNLVNANVTGSSYVGSLAGDTYAAKIGTCSNGAYVLNCSSTNTFVNSTSSTGVAGGLIGYMYSDWVVGPVVGNSYSSGIVYGSGSAGGLVGGCSDNSILGAGILSCYSSANVYVLGSDSARGAGGLFGGSTFNSYILLINNSYATGNVSAAGASAAGGLIGRTDTYKGIYNSYATGNVSSGSGNAGGLVGTLVHGGSSDRVSNVFSTGAVSGTTAGGMIGSKTGPAVLSNLYWYNVTGDSATRCIGSAADGCDGNSLSDVTYFYNVSNLPIVNWNYPPWYNWTNNFPHLSAQPATSLGSLTVSLVTPTTNTTVTQGNSFTFTSNVSCLNGGCGNVSAYLDPQQLATNSTNSSSNSGLIGLLIGLCCVVLLLAILKYSPSDKKMILIVVLGIIFIVTLLSSLRMTGYVAGDLVSTTTSATPFYTTSANPQNCGVIASGGNCSNSWTVFASGDANSYQFFVKYNSTTAGVAEKNTTSVYITINVPAAAAAATTATTSGGGRAAVIYDVSNEQFIAGYSEKLYVSDAFRFDVANESYLLKLTQADGGVRIIVDGGQEFLLYPGSTQQIDVNGGGEPDLTVELIDVTGAVANIRIKAIVSQVVLPSTSSEQPLPIIPTIEPTKTNYIILAVAGVLVLAGIGYLLKELISRKKTEKKARKTKKKRKGSKKSKKE